MSDPAPSARVTLGAIFKTFLLIGATSFGGGVVAYLREALVTGRGWLDDEEFLGALEISQTLPGLNATNMSIIVGDKLRGAIGAVIAFLGMTAPGITVIFLLGLVYSKYAHLSAVGAFLGGVGAASVGLLLAVTIQIGRKELASLADIVIVVVTIVAVSFLHVSLVTTLLTIGSVAVWWYRPRREAAAKAPS